MIKQIDIRFESIYPIAHAAQYLSINVHMLRSCALGRYYKVENGRFSDPLIELQNCKSNNLSFIHLLEAHVLLSMRFKYVIRMDTV